MSHSERLPLADRPKWIVPRVFKWLSIVVLALLVGSWLISMWVLFEFSLAMEASDEFDIGMDWGSLALEFLFLLPAVVILWLIALIADRADQLVWLNASRGDQDAILNKRKQRGRS